MKGEVMEALRRLADRLAADYGAKTELASFSSGAAMLDVRIQDKLFVLSALPDGMFGVDDVASDDGVDSSSAFGAKTLGDAERELRRLIARSLR
jgi:hypothetical protein